jgi:hypothetical protein
MKPEKSWPQVIGGCVGVLAWPFAEAWILMIVMGVVHGAIVTAVPAVGYLTAVVLVAGLNLLTTFVRRLIRK